MPTKAEVPGRSEDGEAVPSLPMQIEKRKDSEQQTESAEVTWAT